MGDPTQDALEQLRVQALAELAQGGQRARTDFETGLHVLAAEKTKAIDSVLAGATKRGAEADMVALARDTVAAGAAPGETWLNKGKGIEQTYYDKLRPGYDAFFGGTRDSIPGIRAALAAEEAERSRGGRGGGGRGGGGRGGGGGGGSGQDWQDDWYYAREWDEIFGPRSKGGQGDVIRTFRQRAQDKTLGGPKGSGGAPLGLRVRRAAAAGITMPEYEYLGPMTVPSAYVDAKVGLSKFARVVQTYFEDGGVDAAGSPKEVLRDLRKIAKGTGGSRQGIRGVYALYLQQRAPVQRRGFYSTVRGGKKKPKKKDK